MGGNDEFSRKGVIPRGSVVYEPADYRRVGVGFTGEFRVVLKVCVLWDDQAPARDSCGSILLYHGGIWDVCLCSRPGAAVAVCAAGTVNCELN